MARNSRSIPRPELPNYETKFFTWKFNNKKTRKHKILFQVVKFSLSLNFYILSSFPMFRFFGIFCTRELLLSKKKTSQRYEQWLRIFSEAWEFREFGVRGDRNFPSRFIAVARSVWDKNHETPAPWGDALCTNDSACNYHCSSKNKKKNIKHERSFVIPKVLHRYNIESKKLVKRSFNASL